MAILETRNISKKFGGAVAEYGPTAILDNPSDERLKRFLVKSITAVNR